MIPTSEKLQELSWIFETDGFKAKKEPQKDDVCSICKNDITEGESHHYLGQDLVLDDRCYYAKY